MTHLDLDKKQDEAFLRSADIHREQVRNINDEQREVLQAYFGTLKTSADTGLSPVPQLLLTLEEEKIRSTYEHLLGVKSLLRAEQQAEYGAFIDFVIGRVLKKDEKETGPRRKGEKPAPK